MEWIRDSSKNLATTETDARLSKIIAPSRAKEMVDSVDPFWSV